MKRKIIITMKNTRRLTTFCLTGALTLAASGGALAAGNDAALAVLSPAFHALGRLHAAGLVQADLHLGNFLQGGEDILVIDGDAVRSITPGKPLDEQQACANLAVLLAQLPMVWDAYRSPLLTAYVAGGGVQPTDPATLDEAVSRVRAWRLRDFLGKTLRDCTLFSVVRGAWRFSAVRRSEADFLAPIMIAPDDAMRGGLLLKDGRTSTVARVEHEGRELVIKRYNLKNLRHALARFWRPSRAWHSWREGHRLSLLGIATPQPLALVEERWGPLRRRAFLVNAYCPGRSLLDVLSAEYEPEPALASALLTLFASLHSARISHGDLKATNLLWDGARLWLIDLDAVCQHRTA